MRPYRDQLAAAVGAVKILGPARYAWLGRRSRPLPRSVLARLDHTDCRRQLVASIREDLYASFYCTGAPVPARSGNAETARADPELRAKLSNANTGHGSWDPGWIVRSCGEGEVVVASPRVRVRVSAADCRVDGAREITSAATVSVRLPKELPGLSPGFFMVIGNAAFDVAPGAGVVRVYWHVAAGGAPALVRTLTTRLNAESVPFRLKVADHPALFDRCDAAVLYLRVDTFRSLGPLLHKAADSLAARVRPSIPAFTRRLAPGVGLAESAGTGQSFGASRCALLAEGIVSVHEQGVRGVSARAAAAIQHLAANGVEIDAPYLEPSLSGRHVL